MKSRRLFLKQSALASGALFTQPVFSNASIFGTDTIRVATIGVNGMGWANTKAALKVKNVVVMDGVEPSLRVLLTLAYPFGHMTEA